MEYQTKVPAQPFEQGLITPLSDSPGDPEEAVTMVGCLSVAGLALPCAFLPDESMLGFGILLLKARRRLPSR